MSAPEPAGTGCGGVKSGAFRALCLGTFASFALMAVWAVSVPLYTGPDEPSQAVHAAALVRGQLIGTPAPGYENPFTSVKVPATFGNGTDLVKCYQFNPRIPAACADGVRLSSRNVAAVTYSGRYPPLYFALIGLPTLVVHSTSVVFLMRLMGALLCAVLLGLAYMVLATWSRNRILAAGFLCALTPAAVYLGSVVNPNGLEIAAAICLWCSGLVLALEHRDDPPRALVVVLAVSACVLICARGLSPLFALLTLSALVVLAGPGATVRLLRTRRDVRWATVAIGIVGGVATVWILVVHSLWLVPAGPTVPPHATVVQIVSQAFGQTQTMLQQMVGVLGWNDTFMPTATYRIWTVAVLLLIVLAASSGRALGLIVLGALVALSFVLPVALELDNARRVGLAWEGRYTLALAVGVPLLAAAIAGTSAGRWKVIAARSLLIALPLASLLGYLETLRRYAVGINGPIDFLHGAWHPPQGFVLAVLCYLAAAGLLVVLLWRLTGPLERRAQPAHARRPSRQPSTILPPL